MPRPIDEAAEANKRRVTQLFEDLRVKVIRLGELMAPTDRQWAQFRSSSLDAFGDVQRALEEMFQNNVMVPRVFQVKDHFDLGQGRGKA